MPKISVIIPVYDADRGYLERCIESALSQTFRDIEIIAVNDGSDNSCETVIEKRLSDGRLRLINQENAGTSVARNTGLDAAGGDYILFLDADDYIEADCCEKVLGFAESNPDTDIVFFGYATEYTNRQVRRVLENGQVESGLWQRDALELAILRGDKRLGAVEIGAPWGKLIKRGVIEENKVRYTPGLVKGQDTVFILNLIEKCSSFAYFPYLGYHYRISTSSISHRYNPDIVAIMEKTLGAYGRFVSENGKGEEFTRAVSGKYYRVLTGEYLELNFINKKNPKPRAERIAEFSSVLRGEKYRKAIEAMDAEGLGFFDALIYKALAGDRIGRVFALKEAESALRRFVVRQYG